MIFNTGGGGNATRIVTGKSLYLADTAGGKYKNIKLVGASVQNGTPSASKPVDIVSNKVKSITAGNKNALENTATTLTKDGLTFTVNKDKSVTVNGTATAQTYFVVLGGNKGREKILGKEIILSGCPSGGGANKYYMQFYHYDKNNTLVYDYGSGAKFTFTNDTEDFNVSIIVKSGVTVSNLTFKPMIRLASITDDTYEPYTAVTAELDEEYELNGINGIYDEIDLERSVKIQRFGVQVFKGLDSEGWYAMASRNSEHYRLYTRNYPVKNVDAIYSVANMLCDRYKVTTSSQTYNENTGIAVEAGNHYIYIYDDIYNTSDVSVWKAHLASNPLTVVYELAEPVETPLSVDELIAFNKLRVYKSGSTLFSGCDMEVEYFLNNKVGQPMADIHMNTAKYILDGATLNIIV